MKSRRTVDHGNTKGSTYAGLKDSIAGWLSHKKERDPKALNERDNSLNGKGDAMEMDIAEMNTTATSGKP